MASMEVCVVRRGSEEGVEEAGEERTRRSVCLRVCGCLHSMPMAVSSRGETPRPRQDIPHHPNVCSVRVISPRGASEGRSVAVAESREAFGYFGIAWECGVRFAQSILNGDFPVLRGDSHQGGSRDIKVVELGACSGVVGLACASAMQGAVSEVLLTDHEVGWCLWASVLPRWKRRPACCCIAPPSLHT